MAMRRPSPALIVACVALFLALGGTSYAVTQLPRNSVGTAQLKANAVTGAKVRAGSLDATDFRAGSLPAGAQGERGPAGPQGDPGTASAYAARTSTDALPSVTPTWTTVLDLAQGTTASGAITTTRRSRLAITAAVTVFGVGSGGQPGAVACRPVVTLAGQAVTLDGAGVNAWGWLPAAGNTFLTIPVINSAVVEAGTYDVYVECSPTVGTSALAVDRYLRVEAAAV